MYTAIVRMMSVFIWTYSVYILKCFFADEVCLFLTWLPFYTVEVTLCLYVFYVYLLKITLDMSSWSVLRAMAPVRFPYIAFML